MTKLFFVCKQVIIRTLTKKAVQRDGFFSQGTDDYLLTLFRDKNKMSSGEKLPLHFLKNNTGIKWK